MGGYFSESCTVSWRISRGKKGALKLLAKCEGRNIDMINLE
jgi:hypothetical protein